MNRRKKTSRRRWTPLAAFGALDAYDDLLGGFDIEDELSELEDLLGDPFDRAVMAIARPPRPVRARRDDLRSRLLTRTWCARVGDCGAGGARLERGIDYLVNGAVLDLQVGPRRLVAAVHGTRRYRVEVEILLPPRADMQATLERVQLARVSPKGLDPRLAVERAILSGGPGLFPRAAQIHCECTCPDGPRCKHTVAAVHAFGVLLDREPEQLLSLWGLDAQDPLASTAYVVPPLAADRQPLVDDLAIFGIDLLDPCEPAATVSAVTESSPPAATSGALIESSPPAATSEAPRESQPGPLAITEPALEPEATAEPTHPEPALPVLAVAPASAPPNQQSEVRRDYLRVIGISPRTIDAWLRSGVLRTTDRDDIYERTAEASRKIADFLAR